MTEQTAGDGAVSEETLRSPAQAVQEIESVLYRLPDTDPVRRAVARFLSDRLRTDWMGAEALEEETATLCETLTVPSCRRWRERLVAAWALGWMPRNETLREQAAAVLVRAMRASSNADVRGRFSLAAKRTWNVTMSLSFLLSAILICYYPHEWEKVFNHLLWDLLVVLFILLIAPGLFLTGLAEDRRLNRVRATAATALGRLRAPHGVSALAAACRERAKAVRDSAVKALPPVLAALTPAHYGSLDDQAVPNLCKLLRHSDAELTLQILEALGKVGDGRAVAPVERLLAERPDAAFRDAAEAVLPVLRERQRLERETGNLLRPSIAPEEPAATLLRPAQGAAEADRQTLLQAASNKNEIHEDQRLRPGPG